MFPIRDIVPRQNPPIATLLLILANGVIFLFELMMSQPVLEHFIQLFGIVPALCGPIFPQNLWIC